MTKNARIKQLKERLETVNTIVFAGTLVVGSEDYFEVRELCTKHIKEDGERELTNQSTT